MKSSEEEIVECVLRDLKKSDRADAVQLEDGDPKSCWYSAPPKDFKPEVCRSQDLYLGIPATFG